MKQVVTFIFLIGNLIFSSRVFAQYDEQNTDTFFFSIDSTVAETDSLFFDSIRKPSFSVNSGRFSLLDTLSNDTVLNSIFKSYVGIQNQYFERRLYRRNMPTVKEIKHKSTNNNQWKFGVMIFTLIYIAFVRISNSNNFRTFILSVFNLKLSRKIWEDQRSNFGFVSLQLFAIYLFIGAIFITNYMELIHVLFFDNYFQQFGAVLIVLFVLYIGKFILHYILGGLLQMKNLAIGFVSNTISVNNFVALVIFPVVVVSIYANNPLLASVLSQATIAIFFISVFYRIVRLVLLSNSFFSFPTFYLFLYLCALEIAPWFIIVKYLNNYQI